MSLKSFLPGGTAWAPKALRGSTEAAAAAPAPAAAFLRNLRRV